MGRHLDLRLVRRRTPVVNELEPTAANQHDSPLTLNPADVEDKELAEYGARIVTLLQSPQALENLFLVATLDDFLGVVYALAFARHNKPLSRIGAAPLK